MTLNLPSSSLGLPICVGGASRRNTNEHVQWDASQKQTLKAGNVLADVPGEKVLVSPARAIGPQTEQEGFFDCLFWIFWGRGLGGGLLAGWYWIY